MRIMGKASATQFGAGLRLVSSQVGTVSKRRTNCVRNPVGGSRTAISFYGPLEESAVRHYY